MTDKRMLYREDVAELAGLTPDQVTARLRWSRERAAAGAALAPWNLPLPDATAVIGGYRRLRWRRKTIEAWLPHVRREAGRPAGARDFRPRANRSPAKV